MVWAKNMGMDTVMNRRKNNFLKLYVKLWIILNIYQKIYFNTSPTSL